MNGTKFRIAALALLATWLGIRAPATPAQTAAKPATSAAAPAMPGAGEVLDHYLKATGGHDAWKKLTSRISKGTIEVPGIIAPGTVEIREKAPHEMLAVFVIAGTTFREAFDAKGGWSDDPVNGVRDQTGDELGDSRRIADFSAPADMHDLYKKFSVAGVETVSGRDAFVLNATTEHADPDKLFFDVQTGLMVRQIVQHSTPDVVRIIRQDFSDYREVDGVKLPFTILPSSGEVAYRIKLAEIQHNIAREDALFAMPAPHSASPPPRRSDER